MLFRRLSNSIVAAVAKDQPARANCSNTNRERSARLAELDAGAADTAGAPVHEKGFAGGQCGADEHVAPDREAGFGQSRRIDESDTRG